MVTSTFVLAGSFLLGLGLILLITYFIYIHILQTNLNTVPPGWVLTFWMGIILVTVGLFLLLFVASAK